MSIRIGLTRLLVVLWVAWAGVLAFLLLRSEGSAPLADIGIPIDATMDSMGTMTTESLTTSPYQPPPRLVRGLDGTTHSFPANATKEEILEALAAEELGKQVKETFPGSYDDFLNVDLGRRVKTKYPRIFVGYQRQGAMLDSIGHAIARKERMRAWGMWAGLGIVAPALFLGATLWIWAGFTAAGTRPRP